MGFGSMEIYEIIKTKEYSETKGKVREWKQRLEGTGKEEALKIREEQKELFSKMKENAPEMHELFAVSRNEIIEKIERKISGKEMTID